MTDAGCASKYKAFLACSMTYSYFHHTSHAQDCIRTHTRMMCTYMTNLRRHLLIPAPPAVMTAEQKCCRDRSATFGRGIKPCLFFFVLLVSLHHDARVICGMQIRRPFHIKGAAIAGRFSGPGGGLERALTHNGAGLHIKLHIAAPLSWCSCAVVSKRGMAWHSMA